jgi:hypothetical protein
MSDTQVLLTRIAALRQRLEQDKSSRTCTSLAAELNEEIGSAGLPDSDENASPLAPKPAFGNDGRLRDLERQVAEGLKQTVLLDASLRQLTPASSVGEPPIFPKQLTARARRVLEQGKELLGQLRQLADEIQLEASFKVGAGIDGEVDGRWPGFAFSPPRHLTTSPPPDPLAQRYQETLAMANTALRVVGALPDSAGAQLSLCEGLEIILADVADRIAGITAVLEQRRSGSGQVERLAQLLTALYAKEPVDIQSFIDLAEPLVAETQDNAALGFLSARPESNPVLKSVLPAATFIASHSLTVARVLARVVRHDPDFRNNPLEPVLAGLLHDAGMLGVPPTILSHAGPLDDSQRRVIEGHTRLGAELMARLLPTGASSGRSDFKSILQEAAAGHHERLDGTGYPDGRRASELQSLTRLLAVCDVYAALCTARPHRAALDTRTALTDTLLLAEKGALDRYHAERLLQLSFYPVGSVVELADGACGVVVATHMGRRDLTAPARPVLALLTDAQGRYLPVPRHLDLAACEDRSIVRTVPQAERGARFGSRYPELV